MSDEASPFVPPKPTSVHGSMSVSGTVAKRTTTLGEKFITFITEPKGAGACEAVTSNAY